MAATGRPANPLAWRQDGGPLPSAARRHCGCMHRSDTSRNRPVVPEGIATMSLELAGQTACATVLVVDDDPDQVTAMSAVLAKEGMLVLPAYNGPECLRRVREQPVDVVVLDLVMPGMDGFEVCSTLKADLCCRSIPVILLTARDTPETRSAGARAGVDEFLAKPVSARHLVSRIMARGCRSPAQCRARQLQQVA